MAAATVTVFEQARSASVQRQQAAYNDAVADMQRLVEQLRGVVRGLQEENGAMKARMLALEVTSNQERTANQATIAALRAEKNVLKEQVNALTQRLTALQGLTNQVSTVAHTALNTANRAVAQFNGHGHHLATGAKKTDGLYPGGTRY